VATLDAGDPEETVVRFRAFWPFKPQEKVSADRTLYKVSRPASKAQGWVNQVSNIP
jgi:hypothetical protein